MIHKLRNRMVAAIMAFVCIIVLAAFIALYLVTYTRISNEISEKLYSEETVNITSENQMIVDGQLIQNAYVVNRMSPSLGVYFTLLADHLGNLSYIDSALDLEQEEYETAVSTALKHPDGGTMELSGRKWRFTSFDGIYQLEDYDSVHSSENLLFFRFLDVTDSYQTLETLFITLCALYVILIVIFFILARYFSARAVRPVMEAWDIQQQFIADASHELKTPISALSANLDVLYASREDTIQEQIKWLDNSKKVLSRMSALVQSMLELARVDHASREYHTEDISITQLIDETTDSYLPLAEQKNISIIPETNTDIRIYANYNIVQQILEILMDNAVKYTENGGQIQVTASNEKKFVVLTVKNTGIGIAAEDIDKVFERFYRGDKARVYQEGSYGLGLSIAKAAVHKLKGKISVESDAKWTVFTVKIPTAKNQ